MIENVECPVLVADRLHSTRAIAIIRETPFASKSEVIRYMNAQYFLAGYTLGLFLFRLSAFAYFLLLDLCAL